VPASFCGTGADRLKAQKEHYDSDVLGERTTSINRVKLSSASGEAKENTKLQTPLCLVEVELCYSACVK
jgi:hypothetical protein